MTSPRPDESDPFWQRLEGHERDQLEDYLDMVFQDPESISDSFNPSRRHEFFKLLAKGLGRPEPPDQSG